MGSGATVQGRVRLFLVLATLIALVFKFSDKTLTAQQVESMIL